MNYKIIRAWTDGAGVRWFTVAWAGGGTTTHCVTV
jgi:hypothetical protein